MKYRCVNFYSAEWKNRYPLPGYEEEAEARAQGNQWEEEDPGIIHF